MGRDKAKWMLVGEVSEYLGISPDMVRAACHRGQLSCIRTPGNLRWVSRASVEAYRKVMYGDSPEA